jgi:hypothetical protein
MEGSVLAIHQPNFLPWIGLIHKIVLSDKFVILDDVMYSKQAYYNRNMIMTPNGKNYLSVPIRKRCNKILNRILISDHCDWKRKHLHSIYYSYKNCQYFWEFFGGFEEIYSRNHDQLIELNMDILLWILEYLEIKPNFYFSSNLQVRSGKTQRLIDVCRRVNASCYVYGGDSGYMDRNLFHEDSIRLSPQNFNHPTYKQVHSDKFIPNLSIADWIFQDSKDSIIEYFGFEKEKFRNANKEFAAEISG